MLSDTDRLRIAIALTALQCKKPDQSCHSYVLELQSKFSPSTPLAPTTDGSWRTHALHLENELKILKERREKEHIEYSARVSEAAAALAACKTDSAEATSRAPTEDNLLPPEASNSEMSTKNALSKKKGKQKKTNVADAIGANVTSKSSLQTPLTQKLEARIPVHLRLDLKMIFQEFQGTDSFEGRIPHASGSMSVLCTRTNEDSLFSSFSDFDRLICSFSACPVPLTVSQKILLLSSTIRALEAIARVLNGVVSPSISVPPSTMKTDSTKTLQTLNLLLTYLLSTCLEVLFPRAVLLPKGTMFEQAAEKKRQGKKSGRRGQDTTNSASKPPSVEEISPEFWTLFEGFLGALTTTVLEPAVKSLALFSEQYLSATFATAKQNPPSASPKSNTVTDIRTHLLSLFRSAFDQVSRLVRHFESLNALPSVGCSRFNTHGQDCCNNPHQICVSSVTEYLSLTTVRELLKLYAVEYRGNEPLKEPMKNFHQAHENLSSSVCIGNATSTSILPPLARSSVVNAAASASRQSQELNPKKNKSASRLPGFRTKEARIRKLARKDAVWYLCTVLHVLFEDVCFSDNDDDDRGVSDIGTGLGAGATKSTRPAREPSSELHGSSTTGTTIKGLDGPVPSASSTLAASTTTANNQANNRVMDTNPAQVDDVRVSQETDRYLASAKEAAKSSSSLLRAGLLESFDALLSLVTKYRPTTSLSLFPAPSQSPSPLTSAIPSSAEEQQGSRPIGDGSSVMSNVSAAPSNSSVDNIRNSTRFETSKGGVGNTAKDDRELEKNRNLMTLKSGSRKRPLGLKSEPGSGITMDEIEYDMVLSVVERYWQCTLGLTPSTVRT